MVEKAVPTPLFTATLKYLRRDPKYDVEKPFSCLIDLSKVPNAEQTNIVSDAYSGILVRNARHHFNELSLDQTGFEVLDVGVEHEPSRFEDVDWLKSVYYPFICDMVIQKLGAKEAHVFEHQLRYRHPGFGQPYRRGALHYDPPINQVHVDATQQAGRIRFKNNWPNYTEDIWEDRLRIINIWRPLVDCVTEWPLALCDFRSVDLQRDLRASDVITRNYVGESYAAHYSDKHEWYYIQDQRYNEAWMVKIFDTKPNVAHTVLHTALDVGQNSQARKSCEIRLLVRG